MQNGKIKVCTCVVMGVDIRKRSSLDPGLHVFTEFKERCYEGLDCLIARANFVAMVP